MKHGCFFFLPALLEACFIFQSASPSPRNSSSHCFLLLLHVCLGGTLTDSDGSLGKMQLGIPWAEHASASVFAFIGGHNQELAFSTVRTFWWKGEIEKVLLEACFPPQVTGWWPGVPRECCASGRGLLLVIPVMIRVSDSYMRIGAEAGLLTGVYLQARVSVLCVSALWGKHD